MTWLFFVGIKEEINSVKYLKYHSDRKKPIKASKTTIGLLFCAFQGNSVWWGSTWDSFR